MKRARLRNVYLKNELKQLKQLTIINETFVLVFLGNRKGLISKVLMCNSLEITKIFGKTLHPFFQIKSNLKRESHLLKMNDKKVAETFHEFSSNAAKTLNISQNSYLDFGISQTDPVLQSIEKFSKHPSIINIKNRMSNSNCTFSFKFETQERCSKLI